MSGLKTSLFDFIDRHLKGLLYYQNSIYKPFAKKQGSTLWKSPLTPKTKLFLNFKASSFKNDKIRIVELCSVFLFLIAIL